MMRTTLGGLRGVGVASLQSGMRWRRVLGSAAAVIALSFLVLMGIVVVYAFILAFQARGAPDQTAISHFARTISPRLMPWLEALLTFLVGWRIGRRADAAKADAVLVGALSGLLSAAVVLAFGGHLGVRHLLIFLALTGLGWSGGLAGHRWSRQP
jgi:hypothetical protein